MAINGTYVQLQNQIADELGERVTMLPASVTSPLGPIEQAIQSAIAKWEREPFYFNEVYSQNLFSTVASQELYTTSGDTGNLLANSPDLIRLHILISGNRYPLKARTWSYLEDTSVNPTVTGQPIDYAYMAEELRLYPIPDGVYPITLSGLQRFTTLSADSDANAWTKDAYDLILCEAKYILAMGPLTDDKLAARMQALIHGPRGYLNALKTETFRRARARIVPSYF